jgi:hypothetical protein
VVRVCGYRSRGPGFDSRCYQIFWEVVMRDPLSLVSTTGVLLGRNSSIFGLENREYGHRDPSLLPCDTLYPQKFALTSLTSGGRSVGMVCSRTEATEYVCCWSLNGFAHFFESFSVFVAVECCSFVREIHTSGGLHNPATQSSLFLFCKWPNFELFFIAGLWGCFGIMKLPFDSWVN